MAQPDLKEFVLETAKRIAHHDTLSEQHESRLNKHDTMHSATDTRIHNLETKVEVSHAKEMIYGTAIGAIITGIFGLIIAYLTK